MTNLRIGSQWPISLIAAPVAEARAELGESPLWQRGVGLRWLDCAERRLFTLELEGGESSVALSDDVTCIELSSRAELFAVTTKGFGWLDPEDGEVDQALRVVSDNTMSMNDGGIDAQGRGWAGSAVRDGSWRGALYRLEDNTVTSEVANIGMSNGIDWSAAGDVLYHVDSTAGTITAWEYDLATGQLGERRLLRSVPPGVGLPDGLTVDAEGFVWLAIWGRGQVWRLDPDSGETTAVVDVPTPYTTSCAFGGEHLSTLYITTANYKNPAGGGLLYAVDVPVRGRQPHAFSAGLR